MIRFLNVKIFIKNAPMRILIARESAPCQPLCSLTFEMGGEKEGKKNQTRAWGGHWSSSGWEELSLTFWFGHGAFLRAAACGPREISTEGHFPVMTLPSLRGPGASTLHRHHIEA